jgi:hypothetical protein
VFQLAQHTILLGVEIGELNADPLERPSRDFSAPTHVNGALEKVASVPQVHGELDPVVLLQFDLIAAQDLNSAPAEVQDVTRLRAAPSEKPARVELERCSVHNETLKKSACFFRHGTKIPIPTPYA